MVTEDTEKKIKFHRVEAKTINAFFCERFFIPFPVLSIKSKLRMVKN
ncbi:hypothetical protein [uncultured Ilyobacter sp.]|nr:hypothetical protein [uncultured Ilyobacter sp.]